MAIPRLSCVSAIAVATAALSLGLLPPASQAIVGGNAVAAGSLPWIARIRYEEPDGLYHCTGTVVAPTVVLTAAHCAVDQATMKPVPPSSYSVLTGTSSTVSGGHTSAVSRVVVYPHYKNVTGDSGNVLPDRDLALLVLSTPTRAPAIKLANSSDSALYKAGTGVHIAGWGMTNGASSVLPSRLEAGTTLVQSQTYCRSRANGFFDIGYDATSEICAIDAPTDSEATCHGDSGGPLVGIEPDGTPVEIGLTSWSEAHCTTTEPTFFTRLASFSSWLSREIKRLSRSAQKPVPAASSRVTARRSRR